MTASSQRRYGVDLAAYMAVCDANYQRLQRLVPELAEQDEVRLELGPPGAARSEVCFQVLERCPYTTMVQVVQDDLAGNGGLQFRVDGPSITVRLYHDACSAEVTAFQHTSRFAPVNPYPNRDMHYPDEKAAVNRFLGEYLELCLRCGRAEVDLTAGPR